MFSHLWHIFATEMHCCGEANYYYYYIRLMDECDEIL